jgi:DNA-binding protein H-NS
MGRLTLEGMTVKELLDVEAEVQKAIALSREQERAKVKREVADLIEKHGFTPNDILGRRSARSLLSPKYANPDDPSQTWVGRGRRPSWLIAKMRKGAKLEQFTL